MIEKSVEIKDEFGYIRLSSFSQISSHLIITITIIHFHSNTSNTFNTFNSTTFKMYAYTVIAFLAAAAAAAAANSCANGQSVYCCNKVTNKPAGNSVGDGAGIANGLSLFSQCSKVDVNVIAIANNLLNKECQANAACCQDSPGTAGAGLVNAALPCVAISNLV
ncbi:hypothetical protein CEK27_005077 [Fusarium fujikuroi]|nr:hypothetical protein CEK27_005077 [Fusarium fujikuroi]